MNGRRRLAFGCLVLAGLACGTVAAGDVYEWRDGKWVPVEAPPPGTSAGEIAAIREHVEAGRERKAIQAVEEFLAKHPDDPAREEAFLLAGQAELNRGRYFQAYEWFEKQLDEFPNGRHHERALQRESEVAERFLAGEKQIVLGFLRVSAEAEGLEILDRIAEHAPGSDFAERALMRIGDYHFAERNWDEAEDAYDRYVRMFGKGPRAADAMLQAALALLASFGGAEFDATCLLEAEQRLRAFAAAFPTQAGQAGVEGMLIRIADLQAEKLYTDARFYERVHRPKAAVFYYRKVRQRYPSTEWSTRAGAALARLTGAGPRDAEDTLKVVDFLNRLFKGRTSSEPEGPERTAPTHEEGGSEK